MISGNFPNNNIQANNIPYGAIKDVVPSDINAKLPENIQNIDAKEIANSNGAIASTQNINAKTVLATLPVYGAFVGLRSINDSTKLPFKFSGEYEKTVLGKLAKAGDKVTKFFRKLIPDKIEFSAIDKAKGAKKWVLNHSAIARSFTTPLRFENKMALSEANGLFGRVMYDNSVMFEKGYQGGFKELKALFEKNAAGDETKIWKLLKEKGIESFKSAKQSGEARKVVSDTLREIAEQPVKSEKAQTYIKEIIENFSKSDQKIVIDKWGKLPIGKIPLLGKLFTLNVPASEMANKLRTAAGVSGSQLAGGAGAAVGVTALGRGLPSAFAKIYEGLTSNFVGGKIAPLMQAFWLTSAALRAKDAPKGQKLATFMDEETSAVSFLFTMPLATSILTKMGGLKYLGMGKTVEEQAKNVSKFREMIASLNKCIDEGTISRGEYVEKAKEIKNVLKGKTRFWQKPLKFIGKILGSNYKQETIKPYLEKNIPQDASKLKAFGISASNKVQSMLYKLKTGGYHFSLGGAWRFMLVMFVLSPLVSKPIQWVVNKIFGKPYNPDKKDEKNKDKKADNQNNPFANLTDEQFISLMQKNKDNIEKAQNDPNLMAELQSSPQKLYDFLVNGANEFDNKMKNLPPSQMLQSYANNVRNNQNQQLYTNPPVQPNGMIAQNPAMPNNVMQNNFSNPPIMPQNQGLNLNQNSGIMPEPNVQNNGQPQISNEPQRTYIPSSAPIQQVIDAQNQQNAQFNAIIQDMDNTEKEFSKYLSI